MSVSAQEILNKAAACVSARAATRDDGEERSMNKTVHMFNVLYNLGLTEEQGWMFMVLLKAVRSAQGEYHEDDYVDGGGYFGLAGETAAVLRGESLGADEAYFREDIIGDAMAEAHKANVLMEGDPNGGQLGEGVTKAS